MSFQKLSASKVIDTPDSWLLEPKTYLLEFAPEAPIHNFVVKELPCECCERMTWIRSDLPAAYNVIEEDSWTGQKNVHPVYRIVILSREK